MSNIPSPNDVLADHLERSRTGSEEDFLSSYREESFFIMPSGVRRGIDAIRGCYQQLKRDLPNARYTYQVTIVEENIGFLEWSADSDTNRVSDGADSYLIRDGYIHAQTIHYTLVPKSAEPAKE